MIKMGKTSEIDKLLKEDTSSREDCSLCNESKCKVGQQTGYGAVIYRAGSQNNGWFATLSPKTGSNPNYDFTIQLMPFLHITHFSQIVSYLGLAENYGISFSRVCKAMAQIMMEDASLKSEDKDKKKSVPIATYGKTTTWKEKKEHLHIKVFPFRGNIGQPYTVDSSFGRKEVFRDKSGEFVKMKPVRKSLIGKKRFHELAKRLISLLNY